MKRFSAASIGIVAIFAFVVVLSASVAFGQQVTGTILGRVTDSTGAVVAEASIQIQNVDTGLSRTDKADTDGRYLESNLPLGNYTVTVQKEGFQTLVRSGIVLSVGAQVAVNAELVVGNVQQHVEVTGEAPAIETTNATVSGLVSPDQMRSLPLNGRDVQSLALLSAGVTQNPYTGSQTGTGSLGSGLRISVNGGRRDATLFLLDGTTINDQQNGGPSSVAGVSLGVEGVLEFRVLTHNYSAEYGKKAGAVISEVTRSGTNQFHGSLFEFVRNNVWDPRTWNNIDTNTNTPIPLPSFRRNQFGASAGGPILKDKLFFFATYEALRQRQGTTLTVYVPNACMRAQAAALNSATQPYLALWGPVPSTDNSAALGAAACVAAKLDVGVAVSSSPSVPTREDYNLMRLDYKISDKDSFYMRYVYDPASQDSQTGIPGYHTQGTTTNHFATLSESHIFSNNALNEFRFGFNRSVPNSAALEPAASSVPSVGGFTVGPFAPGQLLGGISTTIGTGVGTASITTIGPQNPGCCFKGTQNVIQEADTFSKVIGAHSLKFGVDVERIQLNITSSTSVAGFYAFTTPAQLEGGTPAKFTVLLPDSFTDRAWRHTDLGFFVQDDWRVTNRLTLNLGLREEFMTSPVEENGRVARMVNFTDPLPTKMRNPFNTHKFNWSPRIGLAWDPTGSGKTSIRAGGGIFYSFLDGRTFYFPSERTALFSHAISVSSPPPTFYNTTDGYLAAYKQAVALGAAGTGLNTYTFAPSVHEPTVIQYNLDIQRQLGFGVTLDVGYVGSTGYHMPWQAEENLNNPCTVVSATGIVCASVGTPTNPVFPTSGAVKVNPKFADIFLLTDSGRYSYNGLQVTAQKSLSAGLTFQASWTYGRSMSNSDEYTNGELTNSSSTILNIFNPRQDWSRSAFDQRHRLVVNASYQIPFASHMSNGVAKKFLDGWGLNGIVTASSGIPFITLTGFNRAGNNDSFTTDRPNLAAGFSSVPHSGVSVGCTAIGGPAAGTPIGTTNLWFDPCAFSLQPAGTYGNIERNAGTGPRFINTDAAFTKNTAITERFKLEFRVEFFNIFNKAQWGLPIVNLFQSTGNLAANAGKITTNIGPNRQMQLGAKLTF